MWLINLGDTSMKKTVILVFGAMALAACSSAPKSVGINAMPVKLNQAISKADKACMTDADCVAVKKGCCECAGYEAVNQAAAEKVQKVWEKECQLAPCTREMCYVQIDPVCENNVCTGKLKPMDSYFGK